MRHEQAIYWTDINRFLIHRFDPQELRSSPGSSTSPSPHWRLQTGTTRWLLRSGRDCCFGSRRLTNDESRDSTYRVGRQFA